MVASKPPNIAMQPTGMSESLIENLPLPSLHCAPAADGGR